MNLDPDADLAARLEDLVGAVVPGIVAASADTNGLLRIASAGLRRTGTDELLEVTDRIHLGSNTKSMTGVLLAVLADQGVVAFDTPVSDIWPRTHRGWAGVTLLDLLHHRGGAEDDLARDRPRHWRRLWKASVAAHADGFEQRATAAMAARARLTTALTARRPTETVGEFAYSNAGYIMIGAALEAATGRAWEELMVEHVFAPLHMGDCGFGAPPDPGPSGHRSQRGSLIAIDAGEMGADNPAGVGPAGTVHGPLADWAKYLSWVLRGAQGGEQGLTAASWRALLEPVGDYAGGWLVASRDWSPGPVYTHTGSNTLWFASVWVAPGIDRVFLAASNAAGAQAQTAVDRAIRLLFSAEV